MRIITWKLLSCALAILQPVSAACLGNEASAQATDMIQLELPDLGATRYSPGVVRIAEPEKIRRLVIHIPRPRVLKAVPKINTLGTGPVQTVRARQNELVYQFDLSLHEGRYYELKPADNTVEITVTPKAGAELIYASWVIAPPKDLKAWKTSEAIGGPTAPSPSGSEGLKVFEQFEDGRLIELENGVTSAPKVVIQARVAHAEEATSLRILLTEEGSDPKTISVGGEAGGQGGRGAEAVHRKTPPLEAAVDLSVGENRLEVEVHDGYHMLYRSTYRILRRAPTEPTAVVGAKWAVILGISDYQDNRLDLQYADRDAEAMRKILVEQQGFRADHVQLLTNSQATLGQVRTALFNFLAATKPEDLALIFLAGHGVQDSKNPDNYFFLVHDSKLDNLGGTAIPMWDLGSLMDFTIRAQRILVFADTCHSGAVLEKGNAAPGATLNFFNKYLEVLARRKGRLVVTASQSHESSLEKPELQHGVFTQSLLLGLGGSADDNPADGVVTAGELIDFVRANVPTETHGDQHPSFDQQGFDLNLPLAHVQRQPAKKK